MTSETNNVDQPRSLGELFKALRPGAPCPWCGGELYGGTANSPGLVHEQEGSDCEDQNVLWCADCGAEVQECRRCADATDDRTLGAAA